MRRVCGRYDVLLQCWQYEMGDRPMFRELVHTLHEMQERVEEESVL